MSNIWFISDTHFGHANILKFKDKEGNPVRNFGDVQEMNEHMVERWNSVVKPGDKVYHLGDVLFGAKDDFARLWPRLNGSKRLVVGNHDDIKYLSSGGFFQKVYESRTFGAEGLLCTHRPAHDCELWDYKKDRPMRNVFGHIHQNPAPSDKHFCVCVEHIDYTPINFEEVRLY